MTASLSTPRRVSHLRGSSRGQYWLRGRSELPEATFVALVQEEDLRHLWFERLSVENGATTKELGGELLMVRRTDAGEVVLLRNPDASLALVELGRGSATIEIAGAADAGVAAQRDRLAAVLGAVEPPEDEVAVTFWAAGPHGPRSARRRIKAPDWPSIRDNYAIGSGSAMHELVVTSEASIPEGGRLLLWHGVPGTGKTSALRALARPWAGWCSTHFVTDPEVFLGANTSYLLDVLTNEAGSRNRHRTAWKLIVLEDSGELLTSDAHERTGQALSRLLNVTDGLIGQGMQVIILVTTNEPLGRVHPAVQRPGRCWREIEFEALSAGQATRWLLAAGQDSERQRPTVLADLYALARGDVVEQPPTFGFGAA